VEYAAFRGFLKKNSFVELIEGDLRCLWHVMNRDAKNKARSEG
jgi:hypothetical protein